jgi:ribosome maturation factor RimP
MSSGVPRPDVRGMRDKSDAVREVIAPVIASAGFELEQVKVTAAGRRTLVRVVVDADAGIDLDAIAQVSRAVSDALDDEQVAAVIDGAYQLEVTSPGVDRALTEPRHWRRAVGRLVAVEIDGAPVTGRVTSADTAGVVLDINTSQRSVPWSALGAGRVQIEFNRGGSSATGQTGEG